MGSSSGKHCGLEALLPARSATSGKAIFTWQGASQQKFLHALHGDHKLSDNDAYVQSVAFCANCFDGPPHPHPTQSLLKVVSHCRGCMIVLTTCLTVSVVVLVRCLAK